MPVPSTKPANGRGEGATPQEPPASSVAQPMRREGGGGGEKKAVSILQNRLAIARTPAQSCSERTDVSSRDQAENRQGSLWRHTWRGGGAVSLEQPLLPAVPGKLSTGLGAV